MKQQRVPLISRSLRDVGKISQVDKLSDDS
jgi:hypothetical protein